MLIEGTKHHDVHFSREARKQNIIVLTASNSGREIAKSQTGEPRYPVGGISSHLLHSLPHWIFTRVFIYFARPVCQTSQNPILYAIYTRVVPLYYLLDRPS